jgi:tetratricopeptide (TPR) repeat protein
VRSIPLLRPGIPLSPTERLARRRLILQDTLSLLSILLVTVVIGILTWLIFRSYSQHQRDAAARWKRRGLAALAHHNPRAAVYDLRTSLGYGSEDPATEVMLAQALYELNTPRSLQEAAVYLNALWEREPGNGRINLLLARVLARQGAVQAALDHYHAAVYGVWDGNGAVEGRRARLEMVRYEIRLGRYNDARAELLIAASNDASTGALMEVAALLAQAHAPADALHIYRELARRRPAPVQALEGAGQMAMILGRYRTAREYLQRALDEATPAHPLADRAAAEQNLRIAQAVMAVYPSPSLPERERLARVERALRLAQRRYLRCEASAPGNALLAPVAPRWQRMRQPPAIASLQSNPQLEEDAMQLVYDTESAAAAACGEPAGADAALLRIATSPEAADQ